MYSILDLFPKVRLTLTHIAIVGVILLFGSAYAQNHTQEALEGIRRYQHGMEHVSLNIEMNARFSHVPDYEGRYRLSIHRDGDDRYACRGDIDYVNTEMNGPYYDYANEGGPPNSIQNLWNPDNFPGHFLEVLATGSPDDLIKAYEDGATRRDTLVATPETGGYLLGYYWPFSSKPLDELLASGNATAEPASLNGNAMVRLTTETSEGTVTVWASPEQDYAIHQVKLVKEAQEHLDIEGEPYLQVDGMLGEKSPVRRMVMTLKNASLEKSGGFFHPVESVFEVRRELVNGQTVKRTYDTRIVSAERNPDFQDDNPFLLKAESGTSLRIQNGQRVADGFVWDNGDVVASVDRRAVGRIEDAVAALQSGVQPAPAAEAKVDWDAGQAGADAGSASAKSIYLILASVGAVGLLLLALLARRRGKPRPERAMAGDDN